MPQTVGPTTRPTAPDLGVPEAASLPAEQVLRRLGARADGLTDHEVEERLRRFGPNAVHTRESTAWTVLARQFRSALMLLLAVTAVASFFLGERADALIIGAILALSVGLGFANEYRAERAAEALHSEIRHVVPVLRDGRWQDCDVIRLAPGDVVRLVLGCLVPADLRLLEGTNLECDESVLTGESLPAPKSPEPVTPDAPLAELSSVALMGTVVTHGAGTGVVVATGPRTAFGRIAIGLAQRQPDTAFEIGLRRFSGLLAKVAAVLAGSIFAVNLLLRRPLIDALLFSLAIAVGITPQLLPAVVTTSLATGARRLARKRVLVKRMVGIEDLGNIEVLFTDKTGTLTEGRITFERAFDTTGAGSKRVFELGLLATENVGGAGGNPLDAALWEAASESTPPLPRVLATLPFDHERRMTSVLVEDPDGAGRLLVTKGAPEAVLERCADVPDSAGKAIDREFASGSRVVAVASRPAGDLRVIGAQDEKGLRLEGALVFLDPPKASAAAALARLARLGITVKVVTGDNAVVALKVCTDLGLGAAETLTGPQIAAMDDAELGKALATTTVFARVTPGDKARLIRLQRATGEDVAFLGDGVNDAVALHDADVGISVDSAVDVAKDAADIVLLEKDLDVLAEGVVEGRRIFSNTIKYVLMGTSSNFGNMFSAAGASAFLRFLPMLPFQILLNNLLYDVSQLAIPTDHVDEELLERPSHWDLRLIERFMMAFGPVSSLFDFLTFGLLIGVFRAGPALFRSGWFVESLATQTLIVFVIRTRRVPFFRSRPSLPLAVTTAGCVTVAVLLPMSPFAHVLGFRRPPGPFFLALVLMVAAYLVLAEVVKSVFFGHRWGTPPGEAARHPEHRRRRRVHRRSLRWTHHPRAARGRGQPATGAAAV